MFLISFDLINSSINRLQMSKLISKQSLTEICEKFRIGKNHIEITGGDQLRILHSNTYDVCEIIIYILNILSASKVQARVFISVGDYYDQDQSLGLMTGDIFYRNKDLENETKNVKNSNNNFVYYLGLDKTEEINLLLYSFSKLVLNKLGYLNTLYLYNYKQYTQKQIGELLNLSQSSVNNQLNKANANMVATYNQVIASLIEEEICNQSK